VESENALEGLLAVLAGVIVDGHGTPPVEFTLILPPRLRLQSCEKLTSR
jgi:hypothetical protein